MRKKMTTIILAVVSLGLFGLVLYIGLLLSNKENSMTTIKKTKASSMTYSKTVNLVQEPTAVQPTEIIVALLTPEPTSEPTITPSSELLARGVQGEDKSSNISPTLEPSPEITSEEAMDSPIVSPTSILLAAANKTKITISPTKKASLPASGKSEYLVSLVMVASIIIFFSFIY